MLTLFGARVDQISGYFTFNAGSKVLHIVCVHSDLVEQLHAVQHLLVVAFEGLLQRDSVGLFALREMLRTS